MVRPFFTIIIPTVNRSAKLKNAVLSVVNQSYDSWELLVIDDGSTDDTEQIVNGFSDTRIKYLYQKNSGRSAARNRGIINAKGKFVLFLDDDDYIVERHLQVFKDQNMSEDRIYRTGFIEEKEDGKIHSIHYSQDKYKSGLNFVLHNMVGVGSQVYPNSIVKKYSFPENFSYWEDTYFLASILMDYELEQIEDRTYIYLNSCVIAEEDFSEKPYENVKAINHFFNTKGSTLDGKIGKYLVAEKYIQYAIRAKQNGKKSEANALYFASKKEGMRLKFWRYYIRYMLS